jgi:hypothetical protein
MFHSSRFSLFHVSKKARNLDVSSNQSIIDARPFLEARVQYKLPVPQTYFRLFCPYQKKTINPLPFGSELGRFRGVPAYSCHYESADPAKFKCDWDYMSYYNFEKGGITSTGGKELLNLRCSAVTCSPSANHSCILSGDSLQQVTFDDICCPLAAGAATTTTKKEKETNSRKQVGIYLGHMFQCVMASRFWLVKTYGLTFQDVPMAYDIFELEHFYKILHVGETSSQHKMEKVPVLKVRNDGKIPHENSEVMETGLYKRPLPGNILIWEEGGFFRYTGHVAVVTEVVERNNNNENIDQQQQQSPSSSSSSKYYQFGVRVWEQNFNDESWQGRNYSRELPAYVDEETGAFVIVEPIWKSKVRGWLSTRCMIEHEKNLLASSSATTTANVSEK